MKYHVKDRESPPERARPGADRPPRRRRYQPPAILEREALEAMAAECSAPGGKTDPTCMFGFS